jgi:flagellar motor switch protein FliG
MSGEKRSAIVFGILSKENAREVFKHLNESERRKLSRAIAKLEVNTFEEVEESIGEFVSVMKGNPSGLIESGIERVIEILEGILSDEETEPTVQNLFDYKEKLFA